MLRSHSTVTSLDSMRLWFEDLRGEVSIPNSGVPFVNLGKELRECHHGPAHSKKEMVKKSVDDHRYVKKRRTIQPSKKQNCQAVIRLRTIVQFPSFKVLLSFNEDDQLNMVGFVDTWKRDFPLDHFFFQLSSSEDHGFPKPMLFVHQTIFQQMLLKKYGNEFVLIDSTYKVTKYDIPLFLLCVATNVGYSGMASFLTERETTEQISSALKITLEWNPEWTPQSFMSDFDGRIISSLESVFTDLNFLDATFPSLLSLLITLPQSDVYTCDFHREQAWQRWLKKRDYKDSKEEILTLLRSIAESESEEDYETSVEKLRSSQHYTRHKELENWLEKFWFPQKKRWVYFYRKKSLNIRIRTTNGVEAQHSVLKRKYLKTCSSARSLCSCIRTIVKEFIPGDQEKYIKKNVESMPESKQYAEGIPNFLKNRPRQFVLHSMKRYGLIPDDDIESLPEGDLFHVKSETGTTLYLCDMAIPSCSCLDFKKTYWLCKHLLGVMQHYPAYDWDTLPVEYTSQPCFLIDMELTEPKCTTSDSGTTEPPSISPVKHENTVNENSSTCDETHYRTKVLNSLKTLQNNAFSMDAATLKLLSIKLEDMSKEAQSQIPRLSNLPLRRRRTKKFHIRTKDSFMDEDIPDYRTTEPQNSVQTEEDSTEQENRKSDLKFRKYLMDQRFLYYVESAELGMCVFSSLITPKMPLSQPNHLTSQTAKSFD
ncbi:hypothetical protein ScPMuIL_001934 [Solemya velum]